MSLERFCPAVADWFTSSFPSPTACQVEAWPAIQAGRHTLVAAPTGSGKTLAAFLAAIDQLVRFAEQGLLTDETQVVYVSPLKALSNDIQRNLEGPLREIRECLAQRFPPIGEIRTQVRTGDTPSSERTAMRKRPPHILVTTPESLYILLTSDSGRAMLRTARTVIVDEIHAIAGSKRGAHLALSLERLDALAGRRLVRVGLSATQQPIEEIARFLVGMNAIAADGAPRCTIIDMGHTRERDLAIELLDSPLQPVMSNEVWEEVYDRLAQLADSHRTTLIFVNTRRMAERVARHLSERIGEDLVTAHHGSLAREQRLHAEQRLKSGALRALVATASLELGIDIGEVDLVCQLGSTRSIAMFLQRVGRSGHGVGGLPKGRLLPLSRDDLVECTALMDSVRRGELDHLTIPAQPLDVLAQQVVAMVACEEWNENALYQTIRLAYPYRALRREDFNAVVRMLAEGFSTRRGRRAAYLHRDGVNKRLRGRRGARLTAITSGGAIPDNADYEVRLEPTNTFVGTVNEDFAIESLAGDIFQLGNTSWRILRVEAGVVRVEDAHGQPPNIPFWLGEAPARTDELSQAVSRLREQLETLFEKGGAETALGWLRDEIGLNRAAAEQLAAYLGAARNALGVLPTQKTLILERFFDESGGMQLVLHSPFGSRVNRAFGLALRKRFCRKFNFELQAAATEDALVLSLGETHSFPLEEVWRYLTAETLRGLLTQALLTAPMFTVRWRWNATTALAVPRFRGGAKIAPRLQRMNAEDLLAVIFPDQLACFENIVGEREIPDHPLVTQTLQDCLTEAMDIKGLEALLRRMERGEVRLVARDLTGPSPLAQEILNARPYAFLDDAPLEERRTQAVINRRWLDPETAADLGQLDPAAIERVRQEVWPEPESADELHDALLSLGFILEEEGAREWRALFDGLVSKNRATVLHAGDHRIWVAAERFPELQAVYPKAMCEPKIGVPDEYRARPWTREEALVELIRGRLEGSGPVTAGELAKTFSLPEAEITQAIMVLEGQGFALRGTFTGPVADQAEWCERRLLARIHRYTLQRLRQEIEPVSSADFMRFLFRWHHLDEVDRLEGPEALVSVIVQLEGFEAAAAAWEAEILPARMKHYEPGWLDALCLSGRVLWRRLTQQGGSGETVTGPVRTTPITLIQRKHLSVWQAINVRVFQDDGRGLSVPASRIVEYLTRHGASFFEDFCDGLGLLRAQVEEALGELVARGLLYSDGFSGLRVLVTPRKGHRLRRGHRRATVPDFEGAGRWVLVKEALTESALPPLPPGEGGGEGVNSMTDPLTLTLPRGERGLNQSFLKESNMPEQGAIPSQTASAIETIARILLRRYGVVFRRLLAREACLPPWRDLLKIYHRIESRGEIRGGRFVAGVTGEQFALPEAVGLLREVRREEARGQLVSLSGADPLNLVGVVVPGAKLPALRSNRVLYRDGAPIALLSAKEVHFLAPVESSVAWGFKQALVRSAKLENISKT